ncbi:MAG TPA: lipid-binding protein [Chitinophagaceae bacterium]
MKKKLLVMILAAASIVVVSCSKDEGLADTPNTVTLAKHWFVRVQGPASTSNYALFSTRTTYVTEVVDTFGTQAQRMLADTITLDDHNLLSPTLRANVRISSATRTFGEGMYRNWHSSDSLILKEGKMFRAAARSRSGNTVDSIYLRYAFKSDPTTEYILKGHERTGLLADEY